MSGMRLPPLALYVHLPWCERKCPYCDFNSYESRGALPDRGYVETLLRDLESESALIEGRPLESVFLGGGTPSLFSGEAIAALLDGIRARVALRAGAEITLEANPGSAEAGRFAAFREAGVNRLSIGVQSFRPAQLASLGRVHGSREAVGALELARTAGFENINLDLMYGLPDDDVAGALDDLRTAIELAPPHLSWYQLTLEPNTAFHRHPPQLPDEDLVLEIEASGRALLAGSGYTRYEVSAYAQERHRCVHNLNYWLFGDYLGIGAGAHGKATLPDRAMIERRAKQRNPRTYAACAGSSAAVTVERVDAPDQLVLEFMMNALRLPGGVPVACYEQRTGQGLAPIAGALREAVERGWMVADPGVLQPTPAGLQSLNPLLALFC